MIASRKYGPRRHRGLSVKRRDGETMVCRLPHGGEIIVTVWRGRNNTTVHLAAPPDVKLLRGELIERQPAAA